MNLSRGWKWLRIFVLIFFASTESRAADDDDGLLRTYRFHRPPRESLCQYDRQEGVCRRRSECRRPTRYVCRRGYNPIVCCLDRADTTTTTTTTTRRPLTKPNRPNPIRPNPIPPRDDLNNIDITFPDCGMRTPKVGGNSDRRGDVRPVASRRSGRYTWRGKRDTHSLSHHRRRKRQVVRPVIVGGTISDSNSWPWMVALFKRTVSGGPKRFLCGASLVSRRYVITAAHCFDGEKGVIDPSKYSTVLGAQTTKDGTEYPVENVLVHSGYRKGQYYNDVAILRVPKVTLTKKAYPVCLPSNGLRNRIIPDTKDVTVTGWGDIAFGGTSSKDLREVNMPIVPLKECNASYTKVAKSSFPQGINKLFICAGEKEGGKDACQGDSGGPMVTKLRGAAWVQLGVVSFGYGCAQAGYPGVYTRLSQYTKWIYDNTDLGRT